VASAAQERNVTAGRMRHPVVVGLVVWSILLASNVWAQDALARARDLYLSAAYDEALVLLEQLKSEPPPAATEVEQYRMLCLLALERGDEARKAIENIVTADPSYRPSETQTSPRIRSVFQETRKALLPGLVQRKYAEAKTSFEKNDPKALAQFEQVLTILDDPDLKSTPQLSDLRTVVSGFRDLSKAMAGAPAPAPPKPVAVTATGAQRPDIEAGQAVSVVDSPSSSDRAVNFSAGFTAPVVISQPLPPWVPPNTIDRRSVFKGLIEVTIDENGSVTSATVQQSVHPLYDEKLLAMARTWKYKPATRNGIPTSSLKVVEIRLQPSR
jgi:TonB family protein